MHIHGGNRDIKIGIRIIRLERCIFRLKYYISNEVGMDIHLFP